MVVVAVLLILGVGGTTLAFRPVGWFRTSGFNPAHYEPGGLQIGTGGAIALGSPSRVRPRLFAVSAAWRNAAWIVNSGASGRDGNGLRSLPQAGSAIASLGPSDAWTVSARGNGDLVQSHALVEHWNGAHWSIVRLPRLGPSYLFAVSAAGPRSVWAVGATFGANRRGRLNPWATRPLLLHWNGVSLRRVSLPWTRPGLELDKVVATGPSSLWIVSTGVQRYANWIPIVVEHWNGIRWRHVPTPFGQSDPIAGFSATAGNDAWAVGSYAQGGNIAAKYSRALAAHWNGSSWQITPVPNRPGNNNSVLTDIAAVRPDDAWAIGQSQRLDLSHDGFSSTAPVVLLAHWDGQSWSLMPGAVPRMSEGSLSVAKDGSAWAFGGCLTGTVVLRWANGAWITVQSLSGRYLRAGVSAPVRPHDLRSCFSPNA